MKIETKFNVGEVVWYLNPETLKIESQRTESLKYEGFTQYSGGNSPKITYRFNSKPTGEFDESKLFKTKEELLASL